MPIFWEAPARFSTITDCPRIFANGGATSRATVSRGPPGFDGTIIVIGRDGYVCARAGEAMDVIPIARTIAPHNVDANANKPQRFLPFIMSVSFGHFRGPSASL